MRRRTFLAGTAGCLLTSPVIAAPSARRSFRIFRDGDLIGTHTLDAVVKGDTFEIAIDIQIAIKVLGITAYRYTLANREKWSGGAILSVASTVNDDGDDEYARIRASEGALDVEGSRYNGEVSPDAVTTSYYATPFLRRAPWISTQSGQPLNVTVSGISGRAGWHQVSGELTTTLGYDAAGEWVGCEFDAGGELAHYELEGPVQPIAALWADA